MTESTLTSTAATSSLAHAKSQATSINESTHNRLPSNQLVAPIKKHRVRIISQSNDILGEDNFPMGCSFSPDGSCILTATASDGKFRLYDTPFQHLNNIDDADQQQQEVDNNGTSACDTSPQHIESNSETAAYYSLNQHFIPPSQNQRNNQQGIENRNPSFRPWKSSLSSHQGGPPPPSPASYTWYPLMNSSSPLTSLYLTCRGHSLPIHLIDAYTSQLRASYRPYNNVDEMEGPTVVEFSPDGSRIYGTGFKTDRTIVMFDTAIPGKEGAIWRLGKTRRSGDGQKGIPSAMAFPKIGNGDGGGGPSNVFAVGTYSPASIYIYDDRMGSYSKPAGSIVLNSGVCVVGHGRAFSRKKRRFACMDNNENDQEKEENLFSTAKVNWFQSRARGGVTQLMWSPSTSNNPYVLYSASRRSNAVLSWDVRALSGQDLDGDGTSRPICGLQSYARDGDTNQRLEFDLDSSGNKIFVGSGSKEGLVKIYDVRNGALEDDLDMMEEDGNLAHRDAVNGVSYFETPNINGVDGLLAVAIGSRHFDDPENICSNDSDADDSGGDGRGTPLEDNNSDFLSQHGNQKVPGYLRLYAMANEKV